MNYTYMVRCADGSLYTGWTTDLEARVATHNSGKGAKYTKARRPVTLVWHYQWEEKIPAQRLERAVKKLTKSQKERLVANPALVKSLCAEVWEVDGNDKSTK